MNNRRSSANRHNLTTALRLYVDAAQAEAIDRAAREAGLSRSAWLSHIAMAAVGVSPAKEGPSQSPASSVFPVHSGLPCLPEGGRMVLVVADGVGDLATAETDWKTPLDVACTPNLDTLAARGDLGLLSPAAPGVTVGSVSGHLALFGYDPETTRLGRGAVDALGVGLEVGPSDVALRGNLAQVDADGVLVDRRAGRLSDAEGAALCQALGAAITRVGTATVEIRPTKGYRFSLILRGERLDHRVADTDPQRVGVPVLPACPLAPSAARTAALVNEFRRAAERVLADKGTAANTVLLRGASEAPNLAPFPQVFHLRSLAVAAYPTYRGVASACGMEVSNPWPTTIEETVDRVVESLHEGDHDFVFAHYKDPDACGEDGDFGAKVSAIERLDAALGRLLQNPPDVLVITADHATPVGLRWHGWQPVPLMIVSRWTGFHATGRDRRFTEQEVSQGGLGRMRSVDLMPLLLAHARRLRKIDGEGKHQEP